VKLQKEAIGDLAAVFDDDGEDDDPSKSEIQDLSWAFLGGKYGEFEGGCTFKGRSDSHSFLGDPVAGICGTNARSCCTHSDASVNSSMYSEDERSLAAPNDSETRAGSIVSTASEN
jgi:hypothetical protein